MYVDYSLLDTLHRVRGLLLVQGTLCPSSVVRLLPSFHRVRPHDRDCDRDCAPLSFQVLTAYPHRSTVGVLLYCTDSTFVGKSVRVISPSPIICQALARSPLTVSPAACWQLHCIWLPHRTRCQFPHFLPRGLLLRTYVTTDCVHSGGDVASWRLRFGYAELQQVMQGCVSCHKLA